ncbi:potassium voltage-gated channel protein Shaw-like isoform X2 [Amphiura filiformis]|uniref:potassium voltage-gated channel protein Shaw-like isoform X2 n=1 Tax=Amphiura filiformis TaxID=82378 RepID=UPI003B221D7D
MTTSLDRVAEEDDDEEGGSAVEQLQALRVSQAKSDNRVRINVGGIRHETYKTTLLNIPDTRLAWLAQTTSMSNTDYDPINREFYFDRHPRVFEAILNFYRTGKLHAPCDVCGPLFEDELQFWGIDEKQIEPCCWANYTQHRDAQETLAKLTGNDDNDSMDNSEDEDDVARIFGIEVEERQSRGWYSRWQPRVWLLLEDPYSSRAATVLAFASLFFVLISVMSFCMETIETFREDITERPVLWLFVLEGISVLWFTLELIVRYIFCPSRKKFFLTVENIVDIVACVPFYVDFIFRMADLHSSGGWEDFLSFLRIARLFRVFKLARHLSGLQILVHTLRASANELLLLIVFVGLGVLISSSLVYYAEKWIASEEAKNDFESIPVGFWWAVVTMTTVGYGDKVPRTWLGCIVGAMTSVIGVLTLALPVPVIVNNFALYYTHAQANKKLPKKRRRVLVGAADALKAQGGANISSSISGYSTQSTNEYDNNSIRSDDSGIKTGSVNANGTDKLPNTAKGEKTEITVTFTDELNDYGSTSPTSPIPTTPSPAHSDKSDRGPDVSPSQPNLHPRSRLSKRASLVPNGGPAGPGAGRRANGRITRVPSRRRSFMPSMVVEEG